MAKTLQLRVTSISGPFDWSWTLAGASKAVEGHISIADDEFSWQLISDPLVRSYPGALQDARQRLTRALVQMLGNELVEAIVDSQPDILEVTAIRPVYTALALPYELLFHDSNKQVLVKRVVQASGKPERQPLSTLGSIVAAYPLVAGSPYLPLHHEANAIADVSMRAGLTYEELFVTFTAEDLLNKGASERQIVHLAGHGSAAGIECAWADSDHTPILTSQDLAHAWTAQPPSLIVLNFCDSANEADIGGLLSQHYTSELQLMAQFQRSLDNVSPPSSSMALELAHRLASTVLAVRTPVDDTQARQFVSEFYRGFLIDGLSIDDAYLHALHRSSFYDASGIPIPVLWRGSNNEIHLDSPDKAAEKPTHVPSAYSRRDINLMYNALSPIANAMGNCTFRFEGKDTTFVSELAKAIEYQWKDFIRLHSREYASSKMSQLIVINEDIHELHTSTKSKPRPSGLALIDVDELPTDVVWGELQRFAAHITPFGLRLLEIATCRIPSLLNRLTTEEAVRATTQLAAVAKNRHLALDRTLPWDLLQTFLAAIPKERRDVVRTWVDSKWAALRSIDPMAIDVVASRFLQGRANYFLSETLDALKYYQRTTGVTSDEILTVLKAVIETGVARIYPPTGGSTEQAHLSIGLLVATRAWAHCTPAAAKAYTSRIIDKQVSLWNEADYLSSIPDEQLSTMIELARIAEHECYEGLVWESRSRPNYDGGADESPARSSGSYPDATDAEPATTLRSSPDSSYASEEATIERDFASIPRGVAATNSLSSLLERARTLVQNVEAYDPQALEEEARAIESRLQHELDEAYDTGPIFAGLLHVRQCLARSLSANGDEHAGVSCLIQHYNEVRQRNGNDVELVNAASAAMRLLKRQSRLEESVTIANEVQPLAANLPAGSTSTIVFFTENVMLLQLLGHKAGGEAVADELVSRLALWRLPERGLLADAATVCTMAYNQTRPALASAFAGIERLCGTNQQVHGLIEATVAEGLDEVAQNQANCLAAAAELYTYLRGTLNALAIDDLMLLSAVESLLAAIGDRADIEAREREWRLGGSEGVAKLIRRASDGCVLAYIALTSAHLPGIVIPLKPAGISSSKYLPNSQSKFLRIIRGPSDKFYAGLPILRRSFDGDIGSRWAWYGLLQGDLRELKLSSITKLLLALADGCSFATGISLLEEIEDFKEVFRGILAIEACFDPDKTVLNEYEHDAALLAELGVDAWRIALEQHKRSVDHSIIIYRGLDGILGLGAPLSRGPEVTEAFLGRHSYEAFGQPHSFVLSQLQSDSASMLCCSVAAALLGSRGEMAATIATLVPSVLEQVSLEIIARGLEALRSQDNSLWQDVVRQMVSVITGSGRAHGFPTPILVLAAYQALESGQLEVARDATRVLVGLDSERLDSSNRISAYHNYFQILTAMRQYEEAIEFLKATGHSVGLTYCCWLALSWLKARGHDSDREQSVADAVRQVADAHVVDKLSGVLVNIVEEFLAITAESPAWTDIRQEILHGRRMR